MALADHGNYHAIRTIGVNLQFCYRHRNEFGLGLGGFAHRDGFLPLLLRRRLPAYQSAVEGMRVGR
jgi:hypothetical protein